MRELRFDGDLVSSVVLNRGLGVRPLWKTIEFLEPQQAIAWVDRFDSWCPIASEWAVAQALEDASGMEVSRRAQFERTIICEINRLVWLTTYLGNLFHALGNRGLRANVLLLREQIYNIQDELCGGRVLPQAFALGGCRRTLAVGEVQKVRQFAQGWLFSWKRFLELLEGDGILESRLRGLIPLDPTLVRTYALWGIVGKASGVSYDSRILRPHGAYPYLKPLQPIEGKSGDAWSRYRVAVGEVFQSLALVEELLKSIPSEIKPTLSKVEFKSGMFSGTAESAKGPVVSLVEIGGDSQILNLRLLTTGQRLWPLAESLLSHCRTEDFELGLASLGIDPEEAELL